MTCIFFFFFGKEYTEKIISFAREIFPAGDPKAQEIASQLDLKRNKKTRHTLQSVYMDILSF